MSERLTKEARDELREWYSGALDWEYGRHVVALLDTLEETEQERDALAAEVERLLAILPVEGAPIESAEWIALTVPDELAARIALPDYAAELEAAKAELVQTIRELAEARAEVERLQCAATVDPRCHVCGGLMGIHGCTLNDCAEVYDVAIRERDEARAEVARLLAFQEMICLWHQLNMVGSQSEKSDGIRDKMDEVDRRMCQADRDLAAHIASRFVDASDVGQWDANANGIIDNAEELAAYAEQAGHGLEDIERAARLNTAWKASLGAMPDLPAPEEGWADRGTDIWALAEDNCGTWDGALEDAHLLLTAGMGAVSIREYRTATPDDVDASALAGGVWDRLGEWLSEDYQLCHADGGPVLDDPGPDSPAWAALVEAIRMIVRDHCDLSDAAAVPTGRQRRMMLTEDGDGVRWEDV